MLISAPKGAMMMLFFCPDAVAALPLRSGRAAKRLATALRPVGKSPQAKGQEKTCSQKEKLLAIAYWLMPNIPASQMFCP